ncbi:MAG TPA: TonB-dependent receptor [Edaphocola sp.]|nr:TonB-dependent receptor [Edaphocola sp.]
MVNKRHYSILLVLISICFSQLVSAQYKIQGTLVDTNNFMELKYATISVMSSSDSVLRAYTRAEEGGSFQLEVKDTGRYFIRYSHPLYASFVEDVSVKDVSTVLGNISMISLETALDEFIVKESRSITIKGDTIEYTADSFKVRDFATVDELLRKLPGIEIDKNGKISAYGKNVDKMLVDGDEFFSDDPAVLAKMLRASSIDKVQVFDNKSEQARLSGIDDGEVGKAINLTLKDDAKQGYFGKVEAGVGTNKYYQGQAMINRYRKKEKLSAYLVGSNTKKVGLGWEDANNYGSGMGSRFIDEDGGMVTTYESGGEDFGGFGGNFYGEGLPQTINGGVHYDNKYGKDDKHSFGLDYRINSNIVNGYRNSYSKYIMPDTQYLSSNKSDFRNANLLNTISGNTKIEIDSLNTLTIRLNGSHNRSESRQNVFSNNSNINNELINQNSRNTSGNTKTNKLGTNVVYTKKFKLEGRSLMANFAGDYNESKANTEFVSSSQFFSTGNEINYNQIKKDSSQSYSSGLDVSYNEPLIKEKLFLNLSAGLNYNNSNSSKATYDKNPSGEDSLNDLFSSRTKYSVFTNSVGANLRYSSKPWKLSGGVRLNYSQTANQDLFRDTTYQQNYKNIFPNFSVSYGKSRNSNISLRYNGASRQPSLNQIQVFTQNSDPLNIRIGNPNLVQEFRHSFNLSFSDYKVLSEQYFYMGGGITLVDNALSESQTLTPDGVRTYQTVNLDGNWNANLWSNYSFKVKPLKASLNLGLNGNYNETNTLLNQTLNKSNNFSIGPNIGLQKWVDTGFAYEISFNPNYNINKNSVNSQVKTNLFSYGLNVDLSYKFSFGLEAGIENKWQYREKMDANDKNNNLFISNFFLNKSFLKDRSLRLRLEGNDLFNQNIGLSRNNYNNIITDSEYSTLQRYFMVTLTWNFTKSKALGQSQDSNSTSLSF